MRSVHFHIPFAPVSLQSPSAARADLQRQIRTIVSPTPFFLTGEVKLSIDWMVSDRVRYETDAAPDVDNILKPTIDALSGPQGVLIDDCQVQRVNCGWIDCGSDDQEFRIEIEHFSDEIIESRDIHFVQFEGGLCFPFERDLPREFAVEFVQHLVWRLEMRNRIVQQTGSYRNGLLTMPIQRFFHRSRIHDFPVVDVATFLQSPAS